MVSPETLDRDFKKMHNSSFNFPGHYCKHSMFIVQCPVYKRKLNVNCILFRPTI